MDLTWKNYLGELSNIKGLENFASEDPLYSFSIAKGSKKDVLVIVHHEMLSGMHARYGGEKERRIYTGIETIIAGNSQTEIFYSQIQPEDIPIGRCGHLFPFPSEVNNVFVAGYHGNSYVAGQVEFLLNNGYMQIVQVEKLIFGKPRFEKRTIILR